MKKNTRYNRRTNQKINRQLRVGETDYSLIKSTSTVIPNRNLAPQRTIVVLKYQDPTNTRSNVGGYPCTWRYRMNSAYDPDPALGSGSLSGFTEWAAFYYNYRVLSFQYEINLTNNESFPVVIVSSPTNNDVGLNYTNLTQISELQYGKSRCLSPKGGQDRIRYQGKLLLSDVLGDDSYYYDPNYYSAVTSNPSNLLYFNVGFGDNSNVQVNGVGCFIRLSYEVEFFDRKTLAS